MKYRHALCLLATGLVIGGSASAAQPATSGSYSYLNGIKVAIDPSTGRLRQPSPAELKALQASLPQQTPRAGKAPRNEAEALPTQRNLGRGRGVLIMVPEDRMMSVSATVQADGSVRVSHGNAQEPTR